MPPRTESDEKYILDLVAEILAEPDYRWQHRFPTLLGDPDSEGTRRPLPVDGYFPRHKLIVEYWERQHSAPVPIMDEGPTVSGISRGHQRRVYDQRRQSWAAANQLKLVILDYRGFDTDSLGRLLRSPQRDREIVSSALRAAGVASEPARRPFDAEDYRREVATGCFICRLLEGDPNLPTHHVIWRDDTAIAFLNRFPTVYGYVLIAPVTHYEQVTGDVTLYEYLALQRIVYAAAEAVRSALQSERVYVLSLGSQQMNAHVHWHIVPCPPGTPLVEQQLTMLNVEERGVLQLGDAEARRLAELICSHLPRRMRERASSVE